MYRYGVGLYHGCVMSPWLSNLFMDGVVGEVNARVLEKVAGIQPVRGFGVWEVNQLLFANDMALVGDLSENLLLCVSLGECMKRGI